MSLTAFCTASVAGWTAQHTLNLPVKDSSQQHLNTWQLSASCAKPDSPGSDLLTYSAQCSISKSAQKLLNWIWRWRQGCLCLVESILQVFWRLEAMFQLELPLCQGGLSICVDLCIETFLWLSNVRILQLLGANLHRYEQYNIHCCPKTFLRCIMSTHHCSLVKPDTKSVVHSCQHRTACQRCQRTYHCKSQYSTKCNCDGPCNLLIHLPRLQRGHALRCSFSQHRNDAKEGDKTQYAGTP